MASVEKIHHDHDNCEHKGKPSKKNLQVFYNEDYNNYTGFCFSCGAWVKDPYGNEPPPKPKVKTKEDIQGEIQEIRKLPVYGTKYRGIPAKYYSKWGVRLAKSEYDGKTPFSIYYGYTEGKSLSGWVARSLLSKDFWTVGNVKSVDPWGWIAARKAGGKKIFITEGEQDAMALDYILTEYDKNSKYKNRKHAIISVRGGVNGIVRALKKVKTGPWVEVILLMDDDEAGKEALREAQKLLTNILTVDMPPGCKDANDVVLKGSESMKALAQSCLFNAHKPPIKGVITVNEVRKLALIKPVMGLSYPHPQLTEATYGQRFGEGAAIGAGVGLGKTLIAHEWAAHNITVHKIPVFMVLLEEQNKDSLLNVAGKVDGIPYHKPDAKYELDQLNSTIDLLDNYLYLWEDDADQYTRFDMDVIIEAIRFNVAEFGTKFVYLDNMTRLVDHLEPSEANTFINKYASELESLSVQLDIHIDVFSHLNNTGKINHEAGGSVRASQFTGSRGLMRSFPMMFGFERNKHAGEDASKSYINILKNRKYGNEYPVKTQYSSRTGKLVESEWEGKGFLETSGGYKHERD